MRLRSIQIHRPAKSFHTLPMKICGSHISESYFMIFTVVQALSNIIHTQFPQWPNVMKWMKCQCFPSLTLTHSSVVSLATNESGNPDPHHIRVNKTAATGGYTEGLPSKGHIVGVLAHGKPAWIQVFFRCVFCLNPPSVVGYSGINHNEDVI